VRVRWLPIALGVSLLANIAAFALIVLMTVDAGHYQSDQSSSWRMMGAERAELQAMRAHFCPDDPLPGRAAVLSWEAGN
jgi:hypothetical protein